MNGWIELLLLNIVTGWAGHLRQSGDHGAQAQRQQQGRGGQQAPQRVPGAGAEVAADVEQAVQDAEAHVQTVGHDEARCSGPPGQQVGEQQEGRGERQHHHVVPVETHMGTHTHTRTHTHSYFSAKYPFKVL